jgi:hypothetical protein
MDSTDSGTPSSKEQIGAKEIRRVSAGWVDKAAARVNAQLGKAGFDDAMIAALTAEHVLAADETPVNVLDRTLRPSGTPAPDGEKDPEEKDGKTAAGRRTCWGTSSGCQRRVTPGLTVDKPRP